MDSDGVVNPPMVELAEPEVLPMAEPLIAPELLLEIEDDEPVDGVLDEMPDWLPELDVLELVGDELLPDCPAVAPELKNELEPAALEEDEPLDGDDDELCALVDCACRLKTAAKSAVVPHAMSFLGVFM